MLDARARWRAAQERETYLRSLPKEERMRLRREDAEKDAQPVPDRRGTQIEALIGLWQELQGHQLSDQRLLEFANHPIAENLAQIRVDILRESGSAVMASKAGELRLTDWLPAAEAALKRFHEAVDANRAEREDRLKALPKPAAPPKCPNCGMTYASNAACRC